MGRVTVFALEDCPHCKRAKSALKERGIPYVEISLSTHPHRRTDMISLSGRLSVPQIFFNEKHIGGADDTLELLAQWDKDTGALEKYRQEIESQPDPTDERLRPATEPPVQPKEPLPREESDNVALPGSSSSITVLELTERLKPILGAKKKATVFQVHKNAFTGAEGMAALSKEFGIKPEEAVEFGNCLLDRGIVQPVGGRGSADHRLDDAKALFRLQCYHTPNILNSYRIWDARVDPDAMGVLTRLKKLLGKVESAVTNKDGLVDYKKASQTEDWTVFEEAVCELQGMDMSKLDHTTKLAFGINLYNLMIKYSFMKVGIHNDPLGLMAYFSQILFNVGGLLFGFHDLESGILRGNRNAPYALSVPIGKEDPRLPLVVPEDKVDCRIHFGLNCGAASCPPVKNFTPEGIEEELRIVAMSFAEDNANVEIDTKRRILSLSQIINWYRVDFASSNKELPQKIVQFLRGDKKEKLQAMIDDGKKIKIKFKAYDWSTNASDFIVFRKANIQADYTSFVGIC